MKKKFHKKVFVFAIIASELVVLTSLCYKENTFPRQ